MGFGNDICLCGVCRLFFVALLMAIASEYFTIFWDVRVFWSYIEYVKLILIHQHFIGVPVD